MTWIGSNFLALTRFVLLMGLILLTNFWDFWLGSLLPLPCMFIYDIGSSWDIDVKLPGHKRAEINPGIVF